MVSDKILRDTKPGDNMIEYKMHDCLTASFNSGNSLYPFLEIVNIHYNVMMPPTEYGLKSIKLTPHLVKGLAVIIISKGAGCECMFHANT